MKYIPEWFPGAEFKRQAARWKVTVDKMFESPYQLVKESVVCVHRRLRNGAGLLMSITRQSAGVANPSITADLLSDYGGGQDASAMGDVIRNIGGAGYSGSWVSLINMIRPANFAVLHPAGSDTVRFCALTYSY